MRDALRLAVGTLTVIPTGPVSVTPAVAGRAMALAPLAVLPLALAAGVLGWVTAFAGLPSLVVGAAVVSVLAVGTRALHLDGLADVADGLGSGWDRERALAVMKRGDTGPVAVVTVVLVLLVQSALIATLVQTLSGSVLVVALVCGSRCAVTLVCARGVPAARPDGLGAAVAGSVARPVVAVVCLLGCLLPAAVVVATGRPAAGMVAGPVSLLTAWLLLGHCRRRFGGMNGDVIGACVETAFTAALVVVALR